MNTFSLEDLLCQDYESLINEYKTDIKNNIDYNQQILDSFDKEKWEKFIKDEPNFIYSQNSCNFEGHLVKSLISTDFKDRTDERVITAYLSFEQEFNIEDLTDDFKVRLRNNPNIRKQIKLLIHIMQNSQEIFASSDKSDIQ